MIGRHVACAGLLLPCLALAAESGLLLRDDANHLLAEAISTLRPEVRLDGIVVHGDAAVVRVCAESCVRLELRPAAPGCDGLAWGAFCARVVDGELAPGVAARLEEALKPLPAKAIWLPDSRLSRSLDRARAAGLALLLVLGPLVLFTVLGRALRRPRPPVSLRTAWGAALLPGVLALPLPVVLLVGLWDVLWVAAFAGAGLAVGLRAPTLAAALRRLALAGASTGVGLVALELFAGALLPRPPAFPAPETARAFVLPDATTAAYRFHRSDYKRAVCDATYGTDPLAALRGLRSPSAADWKTARTRVVHVGDSMVYGLSVEAPDTFPAALQRAQPDVLHVNAGIPSTGPEAYWTVARSFLPLRPELLVVYLFTGNDLHDMDLPYPCCGWGPLISYPDRGPPTLRCPTPTEWTPVQAGVLRWLVTQSPPPYALRVATGWSELARHVTGAFTAGITRLGTQRFDAARTWSRLERVMEAMRDDARAAGVPLAFVILPLSFALESEDPEETEAFSIRRRLVARGTGLGVPTLDAWEEVAGAVRREGMTAVFAQEIAYDVHFSVRGNALLAEWLLEQLPRAD